MEFDGETVSGTFENDNDRYVGMIIIDSIALPGEISYYEYDKDLKRSIRSNPRAVRYMPLTTRSEQGVESVAEDQKQAAGRKFLREGILYIERNGRIYDAQGTQVK